MVANIMLVPVPGLGEILAPECFLYGFFMAFDLRRDSVDSDRLEKALELVAVARADRAAPARQSRVLPANHAVVPQHALRATSENPRKASDRLPQVLTIYSFCPLLQATKLTNR